MSNKPEQLDSVLVDGKPTPPVISEATKKIVADMDREILRKMSAVKKNAK